MTIHPDFHRVSTRGARTGKKGWLSFMSAVCSHDSISKLRIVATRDGQNFGFDTDLSYRKMSKGIIQHFAFQKRFLTSKIIKNNAFLKDGKLIYRKRQDRELLCLDCSWSLPLATNCCSDCLFILSPEDVPQIRDMRWCWKLKDNSFNTPARPQQGSVWELCCQCGVGCHTGCSPGKVHVNPGNIQLNPKIWNSHS